MRATWQPTGSICNHFEGPPGTAPLTQRGTRIVGTLPAQSGGTIQISRQLTNNKLSGTWRSPKNETGARATVRGPFRVRM
jgi:hypothetical protein